MAENNPIRNITITVSKEASDLLDKLRENPALQERVIQNIDQLTPFFYTDVDPCFKPAVGANESRVILKPSKDVLEFVAACAP